MKSISEKILQESEWHVDTLLSALGILGNISSSQKMTQEELDEMHMTLEHLIDSE